MSEIEYRKIVDIHPVQLKKNDVLELAKIITEYEKSEKSDVEILVGFDDQKTKLSSTAELASFESNIPSKDVSLRSTIWDNGKIIGGVSIGFYHNHASYQIHSKNESWFLGKQKQIGKLLLKSRPWYWLVKKFAIFLYGPFLMIGLVMTSIGIKRSDPLTVVVGAVLSSLTIILTSLEFKGALFPYVKISFDDQKKKSVLTIELVLVALTVISVITGILQLIFTIKK